MRPDARMARDSNRRPCERAKLLMNSEVPLGQVRSIFKGMLYKGLTFVTVRGAGHEIPLSVVEDSSTLEHNLSLDCSELVDSPSFCLGSSLKAMQLTDLIIPTGDCTKHNCERIQSNKVLFKLEIQHIGNSTGRMFRTISTQRFKVNEH